MESKDTHLVAESSQISATKATDQISMAQQFAIKGDGEESEAALEALLRMSSKEAAMRGSGGITPPMTSPFAAFRDSLAHNSLGRKSPTYNTDDSVDEPDRIVGFTRRSGTPNNIASVGDQDLSFSDYKIDKSGIKQLLEDGQSEDNPVWVTRSLLKKPQITALDSWKGFSYHDKAGCFGAVIKFPREVSLARGLNPCKFCVANSSGDTEIALRFKERKRKRPGVDDSKDDDSTSESLTDAKATHKRNTPIAQHAHRGKKAKHNESPAAPREQAAVPAVPVLQPFAQQLAPTQSAPVTNVPVHMPYHYHYAAPPLYYMPQTAAMVPPQVTAAQSHVQTQQQHRPWAYPTMSLPPIQQWTYPLIQPSIAPQHPYLAPLYNLPADR